MADITKLMYYENGRNKLSKTSDRFIFLNSQLGFEGSTANDHETVISVTDPTSDNVITLPDATGTVLLDNGTQNIGLNDDVKLLLGTGGDLEIFHNGTNSIIKDTADSGSSSIKYLAGTQTFQNKDANKTMAVFNASSSIDLHHNGTKKFETTADGIRVSGIVSFKARNTSGSTISKGTAVTITGYNSTHSAYTISKAQSNMSSTMPAVGIVASDISNNSNGEVATSGILTGIDTSSYFQSGVLLYVSSSTAGALSSSSPTEYYLRQVIARVVEAGDTEGSIMVTSSNSNSFPDLLGTDFVPSSNNSTDIGSSSNIWAEGHFGKVFKEDYLMIELSIPGLNIQNDTNAFTFNCPYNLTFEQLDIYMDTADSSNDLDVDVINLDDSNNVIFDIDNIQNSGSTVTSDTSATNANVDAGDRIRFRIANVSGSPQGCRANVKFRRR